MNRALLSSVLDARTARTPIAVVTDLATGSQRLVHRRDVTRDPLGPSLERRFRFDESGIERIGSGEYFLNVQNPPLKLVVIGAVHIAQSLVPMAKLAQYDVTVIDPRGSFASPERFPAVKLLPEWPDEVLPSVGIDERTAVVLLTHDPKIDDPALFLALRSDCFYIGALGSKKTHASRLERLGVHGLAEIGSKRIHAPIGLGIGSRGAPEIAIAIMAEMTKVLRLGSDAP